MPEVVIAGAVIAEVGFSRVVIARVIIAGVVPKGAARERRILHFSQHGLLTGQRSRQPVVSRR